MDKWEKLKKWIDEELLYINMCTDAERKLHEVKSEMWALENRESSAIKGLTDCSFPEVVECYKEEEDDT